jgi:Ca2+/Na+ antiporter
MDIKNILTSPMKRLSLMLWLVALHSFMVGIALILQPPAIMKFFGYHPITEPFFPAQGGVFHIIMAIAYSMAAYDPEKNSPLALLSIIVKGCAVLFVFIYYFAIDPIWMLIAVGIMDGLFCLVLIYLYLTFKSPVRDQEQVQVTSTQDTHV